jgi:hypothetical protein
MSNFAGLHYTFLDETGRSPVGTTDLRVKCRKCHHLFSLCELPVEIGVFVELANKAFCPNCKAGPRHLCVATEPVSPPVEVSAK